MRLKSSRRRPAPAVVQPLESRRLMALTTIVGTAQEAVSTAIAPVAANLTTPAANDVTLNAHFADPNVPGTLVTFQTSKGTILVSLTDAATPLTVANFLSYVSDGSYDDTIFHRAALDAESTSATPVPISQSNPAGIIQGGGYVVGSSGLTHIATQTPVADEYTSRVYGDIPGTIAMAKTTSADSATSEFFFNNLDNSAGLDTPTADPTTGALTSYTVFGKVLQGMSVISLISSLPTASGIAPGSTTDSPIYTPIAGLTQSQINADDDIGTSNLVYVYDVTDKAGTTYTATSSDASLVVPVVTNGVLSFTYGASKTGTAIISVTATNVYDGTQASTSFAVTVPPATPTATGPVTAADTVPLAVNGVQTTIDPLSNDTDETAGTALNSTTVAIAAAPAHGTATVDPSTGAIYYTATAGYTGPDTLSYTVTDTAGTVSAATAVNITVVATPLAVTVGSGAKVKSIAFTQPDGVKGRFAILGGSAVVTFSPGTTTDSAAGGVEAVSGAGATITGVVVTDGKNAHPVVTISSTGKGTVTLGGLTDAAGDVSQLLAPTTTLTGVMTTNGCQRLVLGAADGATITVGQEGGPTVAAVPTATNSSLQAGSLTSLTSKQWIVNDGGSHVVSADTIGTLTVTGGFADALNVTTPSGYGLTTANVVGASGTWQIGGAIRKATLSKSTSTWSLEDGSVVQNLTIVGDLTGTVVAAEIVQMNVTGAMTNATVQTDALFNAANVQLQKLTVAGAMTGSVIAADGNVGTITAKSMSASRIYAGVNSGIIESDALPTMVDNELSADATITSVALTARKGTFASSEIAAYTLNRLSLGTVTASNGGTGFGVSAHVLASLAATLDPGGPLVLTKAQTKTAAILSTYLTTHKKALSDFNIDLY